jgi:hypothetical protein
MASGLIALCRWSDYNVRCPSHQVNIKGLPWWVEGRVSADRKGRGHYGGRYRLDDHSGL